MGQSHIHESARAQVAGRRALHRRPARGEGHAVCRAHPLHRGPRHAATAWMPAPPWPCPACAAWCWRRHARRPAAGRLCARRARVRTGTVQHIGQVIGLVVADTVMQARRAARAVKLDITPLPAMLTVQAGAGRKATCCRRCLCAGAMPPAAWRNRHRTACRAPSKWAGRSTSTWKARSPTPCRWSKTSGGSTPAPSTPARCSTGWPTRWAWTTTPCAWSAAAWAAALAARKPRPATWPCGPPWRPTSWAARSSCGWTGTTTSWSPASATRSAYEYTWALTTRAACTGLQLQMAANCGFSADLSAAPWPTARCSTADNAYFLSDVEIASYRCKTNTQSHTAFRGFGGPQGVIVIETILGDIARAPGLRPAGRAPGQPVWRGRQRAAAMSPTTR
jgi:xanthine dehydrogenase large subunit